MAPGIEEKIYNIPNALTLSRIIFAPIIIALIIYSSRKAVVIWFIVAAMTDAFDGQIARRFNQKTEFGRKLDPIADRLFMLPIVLAIIIKYDLIFMALILTRDALTLAGALKRLRKRIPLIQVGFAGKLTTVLQSVAVLAVLLEIPYNEALIGAAVISGIAAGARYWADAD